MFKFSQEAYSDYAAFFYNPCGGKEIAVVWKPNAFEAKDFKVNEVNGCSITADQKKVQAKKDCFVEDFKFILKDYYMRIGPVEVIKKAERTLADTNVNKSQSKRYFSNNKLVKSGKSDSNMQPIANNTAIKPFLKAVKPPKQPAKKINPMVKNSVTKKAKNK